MGCGLSISILDNGGRNFLSPGFPVPPGFPTLLCLNITRFRDIMSPPVVIRLLGSSEEEEPVPRISFRVNPVIVLLLIVLVLSFTSSFRLAQEQTLKILN